MTTISDLVKSGRITFGHASAEWATESLADGGFVNVTVPVKLDGAPLGTAFVGAFVIASTGGSIDSETHDEVTRHGYAINPYVGASGHERRWEYENELVDLDELADDEDNAESALMDAAAASHSIDYEKMFADALRDRLQDDDLSTRELLRAVQAIAHD